MTVDSDKAFQNELNKWTSSGWHAWHGKINYTLLRAKRCAAYVPAEPVTLYRGLYWTKECLESQNQYGKTFIYHNLLTGTSVNIPQTRPCSWTHDREIARGFARSNEGKGFLLKATFNPDEILLDLTRISSARAVEAEVIVEECEVDKCCEVELMYEDGRVVSRFDEVAEAAVDVPAKSSRKRERENDTTNDSDAPCAKRPAPDVHTETPNNTELLSEIKHESASPLCRHHRHGGPQGSGKPDDGRTL
jgi:hypothetical protein